MLPVPASARSSVLRAVHSLLSKQKTMIWLYVAAAALLALYWFLLRPRKGPRGKNAPPCVTESLNHIPFVGVIAEFFQSPHYMAERCYRDYGPIFTIPIFHKRLTYLVGPEAQETFFKAGDDVLSQDEVYGFTKPVFGANVVYDAGRRERTVQFQTMANGLRTSRMKTYVEKIEREARQYFKEFWNKPAGEVDLLEAFSEMTILTASRCLHGDDVRENLFKEVQKLYHDLDAGVTPLSVFWSTAPTKRHKARDEARREMVRLFTKVIQKRREEPEKYKDSEDILSLFMDIKYKDGTRISEDEVTGLLIALLFAGQHTSCITSTWTALWIANNQAILERVMQEQKEIAKDGQSLNFDIVNQMEYLHNCMRETLRMCPTFIMLIRLAMTDIPVKIAKTTYTIPKGDYVIVSPTLSMRLETVFPNPNTYDPDRYAPPREEHKIPYAYMGFGAGMHSCMGQNFAYLQVKTILSVLFREYEIERVAQEMPKVGYNDMVVGPSGDCRIRYKKRNV